MDETELIGEVGAVWVAVAAETGLMPINNSQDLLTWLTSFLKTEDAKYQSLSTELAQEEDNIAAAIILLEFVLTKDERLPKNIEAVTSLNQDLLLSMRAELLNSLPEEQRGMYESNEVMLADLNVE